MKKISLSLRRTKTQRPALYQYPPLELANNGPNSPAPRVLSWYNYIMRIITNIISAALFAALPLISFGQSLSDYMAGNTALTVKTEDDSQSVSTTPAAPQNEEPSQNIMAVNHLPDVKLNDNIITKTVLQYTNYPQLLQADNLYSQGQAQEALNLYAEAARNEGLMPEIRLEAALNALIIHLQRAEYKQALQFSDLSLSLNPNYPFAQLMRIWIYASQGKIKEAQKEYDQLPFLTAEFEYISSAKLAMAQAYFNANKAEKAMEILQNLYGTDPYVISHAAYLMAKLSHKDEKSASALVEQALAHDPNNYMAQKYQADIQYKLKQRIPAWQSYASLYILDNGDKTSAKRLKKLSKYLPYAPENYLFYTKLSEIYTKQPSVSNSKQVRVGLFSNYRAQLTPILSFIIMPGTDFTVKDELMGNVISGEAYTPKTITFDKEHKGVHIQNKWGAADFSTKRPFLISLNKEGYSFIVKDAKAENIFAANLGDKELKGSLLVIPVNDGMILVNYTSLEDVMPALLMSMTRGIKTPAALEASALALRTALVWHLSEGGDELFDIPDNSPRVNYGGVNMESRYVRDAAKNTENQVLAEPAKEGDLPLLAQAEIYKSCSWSSENGTKNTQEDRNYNFSPVNLFKYMLSNPPKDLYSAPQDPTLWSSVKWIYLFPFKEIEARLKQKYDVGSLKYFEPAQTTPYGRIKTMRFVGAKKSVEVDFGEANFIIAAGTLRSPFFTFVPFKKDILVLGSDSGAGKGLCIDGAFGMARDGKTADEIIKYYYPDLEITEKWQIRKSLL